MFNPIQNSIRILLSVIACSVLLGCDDPFKGNDDIPTDGLVAYYSLNGNAKDESSESNHGTVFYAELTKDRYGRTDGAFYFDGIDDYIDIGSDESLKPQFPLSISVWVKIYDYNNGAVITNNYDPQKATGVWIGVNTEGSVTINYGNGGNMHQANIRTKTGSQQLDVGIWYHITAVFRSNSDMDIYINAKKDQGNFTGNANTLAYNQRSANIGRCLLRPNNPTNYLYGEIDEVLIYNRSLSTKEIETIYNYDK